MSAVAVAPDGSWLASGGGDAAVRIWDASAREQSVLEGRAGRVSAVAVAPDGSWGLASGGHGTVQIWDVATWRDGAHRKSPGVLSGVPHLVDSYFIAVDYGSSRIVAGVSRRCLTLAAAGGTSQATRATGLRQCGQAGTAARPVRGSPRRGAGGRVGVAGAGVVPAWRAGAGARRRRRAWLPAAAPAGLAAGLVPAVLAAGAEQYCCAGRAGVQVNGAPQAGQSRCSALTAWSPR